MPIGDPRDGFFLSHPHTHDRSLYSLRKSIFYFLLVLENLSLFYYLVQMVTLISLWHVLMVITDQSHLDLA